MKNILFTACTFSAEQIDRLENQGFHIVPEKGNLSENELAEAIKNMDGYIQGGDEIVTEKIINSANKLKVISFLGAGYENYIDIKSALNKGIIVTYTPGANATSVAEFSVALLLDAVKKISFQNSESKKGIWNKQKVTNLQNKTVGIIGMGSVGSLVATILHCGFGMKIIYYNRSAKTELEHQLHAQQVELNDLLIASDIISIHIPLSEDTKYLINQNELNKCKKDAILINTARADIVNGFALFNALTIGKISCAAFDVYYQEPLPSPDKDVYKLLSLPDNKFIITPHSAFNSHDAVRAMESMVLESIFDVFSEKKVIRHQVIK
jgi:lactate dehydrogenase-like 2-hydroxyacid dehydrogenase